MRGIRQLGLAQLVFPGASHSRLEHIIGVIGAVEEITRALSRQIERWNRDNRDAMIPPITDGQRHALRLAALFHDVGHGPFSHALEPVLEVTSPLRSRETAPGWRSDLKEVQATLKSSYTLNKLPAPSEAISVMLICSEAFSEIARSDSLFPERATSQPSLAVKSMPTG
jgi:HD superfamily phosphohydrolase